VLIQKPAKPIIKKILVKNNYKTINTANIKSSFGTKPKHKQEFIILI